VGDAVALHEHSVAAAGDLHPRVLPLLAGAVELTQVEEVGRGAGVYVGAGVVVIVACVVVVAQQSAAARGEAGEQQQEDAACCGVAEYLANEGLQAGLDDST